MIRIFISYSHRGNGPKWKAAVLRALHVFEQHHLLDVWQDGKIRVSSFWNDDIKAAMGNSRASYGYGECDLDDRGKRRRFGDRFTTLLPNFFLIPVPPARDVPAWDRG